MEGSSGALPVMVLGVLGYSGITGLGNEDAPFIGDASALFNGYVDAIFGTSTFWEWFIWTGADRCPPPLRAERGDGRVARPLPERAGRHHPEAFGWTNKHRAPSFAMLFSLVFSIGVLCLGSPLQIYVFSDMGYLFAVAISLVGYGIFRATRTISRGRS